MTAFATGALIDGRYRIGAEIGRGGMARVVEAVDERLGRRVAIKLAAMPSDDERGRAMAARLRREALAAARLRHPNVVALYDAGEHEGVPYVVMERVDGWNLKQVVAAEGRPLTIAALAWMEEALAGLAAAHDAGIVHRDVTPSNLLRDRDGRIKVTDFGIARLLHDAVPGGMDSATVADGGTLTMPGMVVGTVAYLSPEQARGEPATARSDVYGAAAVLYEWLTGRTPRPAGSLIQLVTAVARETPVEPIGDAAPDLPPAAEEAIMAALSLDPGDRPRDAAALRAALGGDVLIEPTPIDAATAMTVPAAVAPTQVFERPPPTRRVRRRAMIIGGVLVLFAAGGLGVAVAVDSGGGGGGDRVQVPTTATTPEDQIDDLLDVVGGGS